MRIGSAAYREYSEQVFRLQNRVASDLAFALDASDSGDRLAYDRLEQVDEALYEACALLNEVAVRRRDGRGRRLFADAKAARTAPECERAASAALGVLESSAVAGD